MSDRTNDGCPKVYNNVGFDFMYGLLYGDFHLSVHSSLYLVPISDPTGVMWTIGLQRQIPLHRRGRPLLRPSGRRDAGAQGPLQGPALHPAGAAVPGSARPHRSSCCRASAASSRRWVTRTRCRSALAWSATSAAMSTWPAIQLRQSAGTLAGGRLARRLALHRAAGKPPDIKKREARRPPVS